MLVFLQQTLQCLGTFPRVSVVVVILGIQVFLFPPQPYPFCLVAPVDNLESVLSLSLTCSWRSLG